MIRRLHVVRGNFGVDLENRRYDLPNPVVLFAGPLDEERPTGHLAGRSRDRHDLLGANGGHTA
jgi:hypothetical protein